MIRFALSLLLILNLASAFCQDVLVLGVAQDAGHPQADCSNECCKEAHYDPSKGHWVSSIAVSDGSTFWMIDATPDFTAQLHLAQEVFHGQSFGGIFLTHAHIGHYTGLMYLGLEAMSSEELPVYAMPRMKSFVEANGPWSQLSKLGNIQLINLQPNQAIKLNPDLSIVPILVPHRDEFSETVGFKIVSASKTMWFIPDIDKWNLWDHDIIEEVKTCEYALIDATFYSSNELPGRNMEEIPHPLVQESLGIFKALSLEDKHKVHFIHLNHSNPLLDVSSQEYRSLNVSGYKVAKRGQLLPLY